MLYDDTGLDESTETGRHDTTVIHNTTVIKESGTRLLQPSQAPPGTAQNPLYEIPTEPGAQASSADRRRPDATRALEQFRAVADQLETSFPQVVEMLEDAEREISPSRRSRRAPGGRSGPAIPSRA